MKTYKVLDIEVNPQEYVYIETTDPDTLQGIIKEVQSYIPHARSNAGTYGAKISNLKNRDTHVNWWIMQQLCMKGWEPLGSSLGRLGNIRYSFRFEESS